MEWQILKVLLVALFGGFAMGVVLALAVMETVQVVRIIRLMRAFRQ